MANRNYNRYQALEKEVKTLFAKVAIGSTGAPTIDASKSLGIASITRTGAGAYEVTLQDKYMRLMHLDVHIQTPSAEDIKAHLIADNVASTAKFTFRCDTAGTATDPASGDSFLIRVDLKNSSI